jgi:hypothetical protein
VLRNHPHADVRFLSPSPPCGGQIAQGGYSLSVGNFARTGVLALACAALLAACGGDDEGSDTETTPSDVRNAVFERAFSECGSESVAELAGKHNVARNTAAVSTAVGQFWAEQFGGYEDAALEGKRACLQSIALETPPGQVKKKSKKSKRTSTAKVPPTATVTVQQP